MAALPFSHLPTIPGEGTSKQPPEEKQYRVIPCHAEFFLPTTLLQWMDMCMSFLQYNAGGNTKPRPTVDMWSQCRVSTSERNCSPIGPRGSMAINGRRHYVSNPLVRQDPSSGQSLPGRRLVDAPADNGASFADTQDRVLEELYARREIR